MDILEEMRARIRSGNLAHAYILEGDAGEERDHLTVQIVQAILCEHPDPNARPCGICSSCHRVQSGTHEDVIRMEQSGKTGYLVQDVMSFTRRLSMNAYGLRNIGIIPNADAMTEIVQNKLLKTLEEPSPGTVILLEVSNREVLLDTVRSRCILLRMTGQDGASDSEAFVSIWNSKPFFRFRNTLGEKISSSDEALRFLDAIEEDAHRKRSVSDVVHIEETRKDVLCGMGWKPALKRLYLELQEE